MSTWRWWIVKERGGIGVLWLGGVNLELRSKSKYHIDMEVLVTGGHKWRFTCVYGEARAEFKHKTWETMGGLHSEINEPIPWPCAGDFNEILYHHEKEGLIEVSNRSRPVQEHFGGM